jgi:hypothetical protein
MVSRNSRLTLSQDCYHNILRKRSVNLGLATGGNAKVTESGTRSSVVGKKQSEARMLPVSE